MTMAKTNRPLDMSVISLCCWSNMAYYINKLQTVYSQIRIKGLKYFIYSHMFRSLMRFISRGYLYLPLRTFELCLSGSTSRKFTLPGYIQLEPTSRCNLRCRNCTRDNLTSVGNLSLSNFSTIMNQFPFVKMVKLQGLGEPLLNDSLFDMAKMIRKKQAVTYIATNGTLIDKKNVKKLSIYFDKIEISIDSPRQSTFINIRGADSLNNIIEGSRSLAQLAKNKDIAINFVIEKGNVRELPEMIPLLRYLGIKHLNVVGIQNWVKPDSKHIQKRNEIADRGIIGEDILSSYVRKASELAKKNNMFISLSVSGSYRGRCSWYKNGLYISWNGYVTPCCMRPNYEEFNFGNALEKSVKEIWNSADYVEFRKTLASGEFPGLCAGCLFARQN